LCKISYQLLRIPQNGSACDVSAAQGESLPELRREYPVVWCIDRVAGRKRFMRVLKRVDYFGHSENLFNCEVIDHQHCPTLNDQTSDNIGRLSGSAHPRGSNERSVDRVVDDIFTSLGETDRCC
jgi:hypothetical protein